MLNRKWIKKGLIFVVVAVFLTVASGCEEENNVVTVERGNQIGRSYLSEESQKVYDLVGAAVASFESRIEVKDLEEQEMKKIMEYYRADHPEIFWLYENYAYEYDHFNGEISSLQFTYAYQSQVSGEIVTYQEETANQMKLKLEEKTNLILSRISAGMRDYEKVKYLHDYLATHISYDKTGDFQHNVYGAIVEERAVCDGIARAFQFLAGKLGIESRVVYGCSYDGIPHAWNVVKLGESYYHLDITWDMPQEKVSSLSYLYFNLSDEQILETRIIFSPWEGEKARSYSHYIPIPHCDDTTYYYYTYEGLQIMDYHQEGIEQVFKIMDREMAKDRKEAQFLFYQKKDYTDFLKDISTEGESYARWHRFLQERNVLAYQISENQEHSLIILNWQIESPQMTALSSHLWGFRTHICCFAPNGKLP